MAGRAEKGPGDDASNFVFAIEYAPGSFANLIQPVERDDFFVGRNLKHGIRRGVNDWLPAGDVLCSEVLDDFGSRRGEVTGDAGFLDEAVQDWLWESVWVSRESLLQNYAGHFPVSGGGVFAV